MVTLSTEQFRDLLESVGNSNVRTGTFSTCSARYNGERKPVKVEEFVAAISTFKMVEKISDVDAINGMPMLLEGDAAEWWRGVKDQITTFAEVIRMLRECFAPAKPAWRIYAEIMEGKQQKGEPTDSFIRKKRALFVQLSNKPEETDQIDMLFGMLNTNIRERVSRQEVTSYEQLLSYAREAELFLSERENLKKPEEHSLRCTFAIRRGIRVKLVLKNKKQMRMRQMPPRLLRP